MFDPSIQGGASAFSALMRLIFMVNDDGIELKLEWFQGTQMFVLLSTYTAHWKSEYLSNSTIHPQGTDTAKSHRNIVKNLVTKWLKAEKSAMWRSHRKKEAQSKVSAGQAGNSSVLVTDSPQKKIGNCETAQLMPTSKRLLLDEKSTSDVAHPHGEENDAADCVLPAQEVTLSLESEYELLPQEVPRKRVPSCPRMGCENRPRIPVY